MTTDPVGCGGPASKLIGTKLLENWTVESRVSRDHSHSGFARSCCYKALDTQGRPAFVKAYDFRHEDVNASPDKLEEMLREFNHERRVHERCRDLRLNRVTTIYGSGKLIVDGDAVHFLVCEWADQSLRDTHPPGDQSILACERLLSLRNVAAGLAQLHGAGVAHQDVKPSNAMTFEGGVKITDLGSSSCRDLPSPPHDDEWYCGQPGYAPYELLYRDKELLYHDKTGAFYRRRIGCDLFLLGNLAFTSFAGYSITSLVLHGIDEKLRHTSFGGEYHEVLPYLIDAHYRLVPDFITFSGVPDCIRSDFESCILSMCHPDANQRGHQLNRAGKGAQFGLERYISAFDRMKTRYRFEVGRRAA